MTEGDGSPRGRAPRGGSPPPAGAEPGRRGRGSGRRRRRHTREPCGLVAGTARGRRRSLRAALPEPPRRLGRGAEEGALFARRRRSPRRRRGDRAGARRAEGRRVPAVAPGDDRRPRARRSGGHQGPERPRRPDRDDELRLAGREGHRARAGHVERRRQGGAPAAGRRARGAPSARPLGGSRLGRPRHPLLRGRPGRRARPVRATRDDGSQLAALRRLRRRAPGPELRVAAPLAGPGFRRLGVPALPAGACEGGRSRGSRA